MMSEHLAGYISTITACNKEKFRSWLFGASIAFGCALHGLACRAETELLEQVTLPSTEVRYLSAQSNGVGYKLYIGLPPNYKSEDREYAVLYVLDADYAFPLAHTIADHLSERGDIPPLIVVGIAYAGTPNYRLHRTRDYTPYFVRDGGYGPRYQVASGGAERFQQFLAKELLPFVGAHYRANRTRYLAGHSFGGLFATWSMLTAPKLFDGYIVVSPSLWYADRRVFSHIQADDEAERSPVKLFLAVGEREVSQQHDMVADSRLLFEMAGNRVEASLLVADGETHNSVFPRALSDGIQYLLATATLER